MMRQLLALGVLVLLAGCEQRAADGYVFGEPEFERSTVTVEVETYANLAALRRAYPGADLKDRELFAWGELSRSGGPCRLHVVDPRKTYAPEWLGHELAHCLYGRWHDQGEPR